MSDPGITLAMLAWLTSGLAAVAVAPQNRAAQVLLAGGGGITLTLLLTPFVSHAPATPSGALLIGLQNLGFFAADLAITALLLTFPSGTLQRRWHGTALLILTALAVLTELLLLFAAPRMSIDRSGPTGVALANPLAIPGLASLEPVVEALWNSTLVWPLVGLVVLIDRIRTADRERRRELRPLLGGIAVLVLLVILQLLAIAADLRLQDPGFAFVFQLALAVLPVVLLIGIASRTRALDADLSASRTRLITAEDRVRRDIERDIHDGVQQQLVAILSLTQLARREQRRDPAAATATMDDIAGQVQGAIGDLRELVSGIRPPVLKDAGVGAALASRIERLPADVALELCGDRSARWDDAVEAAAYFVGCEAVTNALKHAPGSAVAVQVTDSAAELAVVVTDQGPGIAGAWAHGRGLSGLQDRVHSLGGTFQVGSTLSGGTRVVARFTERTR